MDISPACSSAIHCRRVLNFENMDVEDQPQSKRQRMSDSMDSTSSCSSISDDLRVLDLDENLSIEPKPKSKPEGVTDSWVEYPEDEWSDEEWFHFRDNVVRASSPRPRRQPYLIQANNSYPIACKHLVSIFIVCIHLML